MSTQLVLASASPARLRTLRAAGLDPAVIVSGVDEEVVTAPTVADLVGLLARLKAEAVATAVDQDHQDPRTLIIIGCDSLLELDGEPLGKPRSAEEAVERWRRMGGRCGDLHTGHHVIVRRGSQSDTRSEVASTTVRFAELSEAEIATYVASGEPLQVAGGFTLDGLGGAFVTGVEGDHHNVVGISLPVLRRLLGELSIEWTSLWRHGPSVEPPG
jgi:septum formation protein